MKVNRFASTFFGLYEAVFPPDLPGARAQNSRGAAEGIHHQGRDRRRQRPVRPQAGQKVDEV